MGLHVAVIGTGDWAEVHLQALTDSPVVEQVSLCGRNQQRLDYLQAQYPIVSQSFTDPQSVYSDQSIDVVNVVLPHHLHAETSKQALASGKHVICEKPGATQLADFDSVVQAAKQSGRWLLIVMNQLYNPVYLAVQEAVSAGRIGRPFLSVENAFSDASRNYRRPDYWRNTRVEAGGGILIDGGFHMVYRHLHSLAGCGNPIWVQADAEQLNVRTDGSLEPGKGEDFVSLVIGYDSGLRVQLAHGWTLAATPQRTRQSFLAGSEATLELTDQPDQPLVLLRAEKEPEAVAVADGPRTGRETTHACLLDYFDALASGRDLKVAQTSLARTTLAVILAAYESGTKGQRVNLQ